MNTYCRLSFGGTRGIMVSSESARWLSGLCRIHPCLIAPKKTRKKKLLQREENKLTESKLWLVLAHSGCLKRWAKLSEHRMLDSCPPCCDHRDKGGLLVGTQVQCIGAPCASVGLLVTFALASGFGILRDMPVEYEFLGFKQK